MELIIGENFEVKVVVVNSLFDKEKHIEEKNPKNVGVDRFRKIERGHLRM